MLTTGQILLGADTGVRCKIGKLLGSGGQGEVYEAEVENRAVAVKWYYPHTADENQRETILRIVEAGPPNDTFLWPIELLKSPDLPGFGYYMNLRTNHFKSIIDLMKRRIDVDFRTLASIGFNLSNSFLDLHSRGLCYRDISFGNVFFDSHTGEILICDNDNVAFNGDKKCGVLGTPKFMAPEIVRGDEMPSVDSDLFSLAVLLFYLFFLSHPLEGSNEYNIRSLDLPAMRRLYGENPIFIFDPKNASNRPVASYHRNAIAFWSVYPDFLKKLFIKAFTKGISDPSNGRVRESVWRKACIRLRDSIMYCSCGKQNFFEINDKGMQSSKCWKCGRSLTPPFRIRLKKNVVILNFDSKLYPHHTRHQQKDYDFSKPTAEVSQHPRDPSIWGLKNLSSEKWVCTKPNGTIEEVPPGRSIRMINKLNINFGQVEGEIRL